MQIIGSKLWQICREMVEQQILVVFEELEQTVQNRKKQLLEKLERLVTESVKVLIDQIDEIQKGIERFKVMDKWWSQWAESQKTIKASNQVFTEFEALHDILKVLTTLGDIQTMEISPKPLRVYRKLIQC